jgi:CheY-like chemotaxis protein
MTNANKVSVFSIDPIDEHQMALAKILEDAQWPAGPIAQGSAAFCSTEETVSQLHQAGIPIVLCDGEFGWREILDEFRALPDPPFLIVTSRLADDRLWSEALNLGAYDVLAKPYDPDEVLRVLDLAWIRWVERSATPVKWNRRPQAQLAMSA